MSKSKAAWLASQEAKLQSEFAPQLATLRQQCVHQIDQLTQEQARLESSSTEVKRLQAQVDDQALLLADRKLDLTKANEELRTQLRLLEAKASPDAVWVEAFSRGFEKAWEAMWPLMAEALQRGQAAIEQAAIDQTLARLDDTVVARAEALGHTQARSLSELHRKRAEFLQKRTAAKAKQDHHALARYDHFLEALEWMLHADGLHPDQPVSQ